MVPPQIKNLTNLELPLTLVFFPFWEIVSLYECKRMEEVATNQGHRLTQELTLTIVFFSFGVRLARTKCSEKIIQMHQNERKRMILWHLTENVAKQKTYINSCSLFI